MLTLPLALRTEKNKLNATAPWVLLLDLTLPDASHVRLAKNTEDVTFAANTYSAFSFELGENKSGSAGAIPSLSLTVANPAGALTPTMEAYSGFVGCPVSIYVVHTDNLGADYTDLTLAFTVLAATMDGDNAVFTVGAENPMRRRFPLYVAMPRTCGWIFKGAECAYTGGISTCDRTYDTCKALANTPRFGGRPGILGAPKFR